MTDRIEIPPETSAGQRGPGSVGDRLMIGIAAIALLGGLFIAAGKVLTNGDASAQASASPRSSSLTSQPPTPIPSPAVITVTAGNPPSLPMPAPPTFNGWIRALVDLPIRQAPSSGASQVADLAKGEVASVEEVPAAVHDGTTWLQLDSGRYQGYVVAANDGARDLVRRYAPPLTPNGAGVWGLVAGTNQFIAYGSTASAAGDTSRSLILVSTDGAAWHSVDISAFGGRVPDHVAFGPAGWLAVASTGPEPAIVVWLWSSVDGLNWQSVGKMTGIDGGRGGYVSELVANESGYEILQQGDERSGRSSLWAWHSTDGLTWTRSSPYPGSEYYQMAASRTGFYAWTAEQRVDRPPAFYSSDGVRWSPVSSVPTGIVRTIVGVDDGLMTIDVSPVTGLPRVWTGSVTGETLAWHQEPDVPVFAAGGVASVASSGSTAIAFGWDRETLRPLVWYGKGAAWVEADLPAGAFGGEIPYLVAANAHGSVAVGFRRSLQADNPVMWQGSPSVAWAPVAVRELAYVGDATADGCPSRPREALEFVVLPAAKAIACFGRGSMTFTAWLAVCNDCGDLSGDSQPDWLLGSAPRLRLSPISGDPYGSLVAISPTVKIDPGGLPLRQFEVTGHYDDAASSSCRTNPDLQTGAVAGSRTAAVYACRATFVVTGIRPPAGG